MSKEVWWCGDCGQPTSGKAPHRCQPKDPAPAEPTEPQAGGVLTLEKAADWISELAQRVIDLRLRIAAVEEKVAHPLIHVDAAGARWLELSPGARGVPREASEHDDPRSCSPCQHEKAYSNALLMSHPPKREWICRLCLAEGREILMPTDDEGQEYRRLLREKQGAEA